MDGNAGCACHLPMERQVDNVHWLTTGPSADGRALALVSGDKQSQVEVLALRWPDSTPPDAHSVGPTPVLAELDRWPLDSRATDLQVMASGGGEAVIVAGTSSGALSMGLFDGQHGRPEAPLPQVHASAVVALDIQPETRQVLSVDEAGRFCLTPLGPAQGQTRVLFDFKGALSIGALRWTSATTFLTGGQGDALLMWDVRQAGPASRSPAAGAASLESTTCMDVHPSRKYLCVVGGASGAVLMWDLRWQRQPLVLAAPPARAPAARAGSPSLVVESGVRQVRFDRVAHLSTAALGVAEQGALPPVMLSTEDGQLALAGAGEACRLMRDIFSISSFDVDSEFGQDVICTSESEKLLYLRRPRYM
ncbi:hypothetical protein KFL_006090080 [Klebsormidium nitens]|uniref:Uncharacterized protein n=1 Tax=Klebsormidium nitens TaxID=105231 RepID=A0A1Y1IJ84_KLENI|nr:hypothetical protein KFL_006090080 [Klebsormidium nitens]|eukprot:GAQ90182.1 hypothetical protein KFL_006090080 [Klebsormidium nitens]